MVLRMGSSLRLFLCISFYVYLLGIADHDETGNAGWEVIIPTRNGDPVLRGALNGALNGDRNRVQGAFSYLSVQPGRR